MMMSDDYLYTHSADKTWIIKKDNNIINYIQLEASEESCEEKENVMFLYNFFMLAFKMSIFFYDLMHPNKVPCA